MVPRTMRLCLFPPVPANLDSSHSASSGLLALRCIDQYSITLILGFPPQGHFG